MAEMLEQVELRNHLPHATIVFKSFPRQLRVQLQQEWTDFSQLRLCFSRQKLRLARQDFIGAVATAQLAAAKPPLVVLRIPAIFGSQLQCPCGQMTSGSSFRLELGPIATRLQPRPLQLAIDAVAILVPFVPFLEHCMQSLRTRLLWVLAIDRAPRPAHLQLSGW